MALRNALPGSRLGCTTPAQRSERREQWITNGIQAILAATTAALATFASYLYCTETPSPTLRNPEIRVAAEGELLAFECVYDAGSGIHDGFAAAMRRQAKLDAFIQQYAADRGVDLGDFDRVVTRADVYDNIGAFPMAYQFTPKPSREHRPAE